MRTTFATLALATAALTATAAAAREPRQSFTHDGHTYVYTSQVSGDHQVITGRSYPSGAPFRLVVRGDRVSGFSGGYPVSFRTANAAGAAQATRGIETAAR